MTPEQQKAIALANARKRQAEASKAAPPVIATTKDGGKVYRMDDGSLSFSSPGMSTNNQDAIKKLMEGATPADASVYGNVMEGGRFGTAVRSALQGMTFGSGDELAAAGASLLPGGGSYDAELQRERMRLQRGRDQYPGTAISSEIAGAVAVPVGGVATTGSKAAQIGKSALLGGVLSSVYGFLSGEGGAKNRAQNALDAVPLGVGVGAAAPLVGMVAQRGVDAYRGAKAVRAAAENAPTTEQLRAAGNAAYKAVEDAGVVISPEAAKDALGGMVTRMKDAGMDTGKSSLTPKSARVAQIAAETAQSPNGVPFRELDLLRRKAGEAAGDVMSRLEASVGSEGIQAIDDFIRKLTPGQISSGRAEEVPRLIEEARAVWAKMRRSDLIDTAIENSQNYLSGEASGIRNQFARILKNPKLSRGFSDAEKRLMRRVVSGSIPEKLLHLVGGGMGQLATIGAGLGLGGLPGAVVAAGAASGVRKASEAVASRNAEILRRVIANGGIPQLPAPSVGTRAAVGGVIQRGAAPIINAR